MPFKHEVSGSSPVPNSSHQLEVLTGLPTVNRFQANWGGRRDRSRPRVLPICHGYRRLTDRQDVSALCGEADTAGEKRPRGAAARRMTA